ncbi:MAG: MaoC family dehydratase N-terminal domain-containing protein [Pseudomonadota bacterium]|nr:MaoC family dehydratase N-terminal domain-containing protein [Pseudomonadota bacterium]
MADFHVAVGEVSTFSKTVGESDVYLFAGITGDLSPNHVNEHEMAQTVYGGRIAHGALLVGYMSACSTMATAKARGGGETPVSLGYDNIRFLRGVRIGDTVTVHYRIEHVDALKRRSVAKVEMFNQHGALVAVASHILKWVADAAPGRAATGA